MSDGLPGYDAWKTRDPRDDNCEFCGATPYACRGGWQPEDCTGECRRAWRDPDASYEAERERRDEEAAGKWERINDD